MRPINYQLTNTLVNNLIKLETTLSKISANALSDDSSEKLIAEQTQNEIFYIAHTIGLEITLKDAEKFLLGKIDSTDNLKLKILNNYKNTVDYIRSTKNDNYTLLSNDLILHLNKLLINGWKNQWEARWRTDLNIEQSLDDWLQLLDDSIQVSEIEKEINVTFDWYQTNSKNINDIIRIAVVVYRLIRIAPFINLNKLTIIAITDFLLQKTGYSSISYVPTAKIFNNNSSEFLDLWKSASASPTGNITTWIEVFTDKISAALIDQLNLITDFEEKQKKKVDQPFLNLNKRQLKILRYLQTIPYVKREDYVQMFNVSTMTAYRDLNELLKKKLIKNEGQGRATIYLLANR